MNVKRLSLVVVLVLLTFICFLVMDNKYDPLARYQYATKENRETILKYMNQEDIDYIIQQKIKPEQFMQFITMEGFNAKNILFYEACLKMKPTELAYIVSFVNQYRPLMAFSDMENYLTNYTYDDLSTFFSDGYPYIKDAKLIANASDPNLTLLNNDVVFRYIPTNLVSIDTSIIPHVSKTSDPIIYVKEEVVSPLQSLCGAIQATNNETCGGLILTSGYISYEQQIELYEAALVKYGFDQFSFYESYPGQSDSQLGYTLTFTIAGKDETQILQSEQVKWIKENAATYGFVVSYPEGEENKTGKYYQPLTLRYVGSEKE